MAGKRGDLESVAFTHEDFGPEAIDHNGEDNIVSVLYAGKTKKGFGSSTLLFLSCVARLLVL